MIGELHGFGARGDDQLRFERAAADYFAGFEARHQVSLFRPIQIRRAWWGDVGGFVAETFEIVPPKKAAAA